MMADEYRRHVVFVVRKGRVMETTFDSVNDVEKKNAELCKGKQKRPDEKKPKV